jgi:hypothetical protein
VNEQEVKSGKKRPVCSVTGCDCRCGDSGRCLTRLGDGVLEPLPGKAVRWAQTALLRLDAAREDLDLALAACPRSRQAPELREAQRLIGCAKKSILERT